MDSVCEERALRLAMERTARVGSDFSCKEVFHEERSPATSRNSSCAAAARCCRGQVRVGVAVQRQWGLQAVSICDSTIEIAPVEPPSVKPIVPPSIEPIAPPRVPPVGTTQCVQVRLASVIWSASSASPPFLKGFSSRAGGGPVWQVGQGPRRADPHRGERAEQLVLLLRVPAVEGRGFAIAASDDQR